MQTNNFSAYQIYWVEFRATSGIVTLKDLKILAKSPTLARKYSRGQKSYFEHFASKELAIEYISSRTELFGRLNKKYEVRLCTDKQFGQSYWKDGSRIVSFTTKQEDDMFIIG